MKQFRGLAFMTSAVDTAAAASDIGEKKPLAPGHVPGESSMWFFIIGDLLIFGVYFVCYMIYRGQNQALFLHSQQYLNQGIGAANTVVLLTSSLFVALGTEAARGGKPVEAYRLFGLALAFGVAFPILKMVEWIPKVSAGMTPGENLFFMYYYVMTGLHLCHVLLGLVIMGFVMRDLRVSNEPNIKFVETGAMYWHMVDLLWLVLFALFYLMR
jgi:nitric oxide reductase NorE protein